MRTTEPMSGCACCGINRRQFMAAGCATCAGSVAWTRPARSANSSEGSKKLRIRVIYSLHAAKQPGPDWPNVGFDFRPVMKSIEATLAECCPDMEFLPATANGPQAAEKILAEDQSAGIDGYVVYQMNCWNKVVQTVTKTGKPTLYVDFQYGGSGGFLVYTADFLRHQAPNLGFVASSNLEDLVTAIKCFEVVRKGGTAADFVAATTRVRKERTPALRDSTCRDDSLQALTPDKCLTQMKASKILAVGGGWPGIAPAISKEMGIQVVNVPFAEVNAAWEKASKEEANEIADKWQSTAARVAGVNRKTLEASAAMYLAQKAVLANYGANAITINCLGGFYGGHIHAYPCLGFHELLNEGLIGACECDLRSTATMVAMTALTKGRPGFISDPVIDTAKRQIIYAHCVASNRVFGPDGTANSFQILTHSEDRQGASVRSTLPLGYMTTTVEFAPERKTILMHAGRATENVLDDRACRTKLAVEPRGDMEKLFGEWDQWGWHRVTYYGDLQEPVSALAEAMGWNVLVEA